MSHVFDFNALIVAVEQANAPRVGQNAAIVQAAEINQAIGQDVAQNNDQQNVVVFGDGNGFAGDVFVVTANENNQNADQTAVNVAEINQEQDAAILQEQDVVIDQVNAALVDVFALFA